MRGSDHLSARDKQFIADLFPRDPVYATLFPEKVQAMIGQPGEGAKAALRILEKVGFQEPRFQLEDIFLPFLITAVGLLLLGGILRTTVLEVLP